MIRSEDMIIRARDLTKRFGDFVAVDSVSLSVKRGEIFGFLGPNGAGKSTTIRMLAGILAPTSGTAEVDGFDVGKQPDRVKERIGYMSQKFSLYPDLTVWENIRFYGGIYRLPAAKVRERGRWAVEMAGLSGQEDRLTGQLSGGWKQRLALGCAILHEPPMLFLDEPTSGVDPISRRRFWDLIYRLVETGTTVFVTTHFLDEAEHCDRLVLIYRGQVISLDSPAALKRDVDGVVLNVVCDHTDDVTEMLRDEGWARQVALFGSSVHVLVDDEDAGSRKVREVLDARGIEIKSIARIDPTLEDVFIQQIELADRNEAIRSTSVKG